MLRSKDIPLFRHRHMGINLCNINRAVPKHFLDIPDINIRFQKACCKGMAEHVGRDMQIYGGKGGVLVYHPAHGLIR